MNNVIQENLRINNPIGFSFSRVTTKDTQLGDIFLPKGVCVVSGLRENGYSESVWDKPYEFNPDRFNNLTEDQKEHHMPFLSGPRICPGKQLTLLEQELYLTKLLRRYKVNFAPGSSFSKHAIDRFIITPQLDIKFTFTPL